MNMYKTLAVEGHPDGYGRLHNRRLFAEAFIKISTPKVGGGDNCMVSWDRENWQLLLEHLTVIQDSSCRLDRDANVLNGTGRAEKNDRQDTTLAAKDCFEWALPSLLDMLKINQAISPIRSRLEGQAMVPGASGRPEIDEDEVQEVL